MHKLNLFILIFFISGILVSCQSEKEKPNILFIAVDDLRTELGCYGNTQIISPNIDQLASEGLAFNRTYCQQPICMASRASLMSGLRPDTLHIYNCLFHFRNVQQTRILQQYISRLITISDIMN